MTVERQLSHRPGGDVYLVSRDSDGRRLALKHISIPRTESQTRALIYAGAVKDEAEAQRYYSAQAKDLKSEVLLLNGVKNAGNLLKFRGYQVDQKYVGIGYDFYLLSDYCTTLATYRKPFTKLQAVNLGLDLCSALMQLQSVGLLHKNVHPRNVFLGQNGRFMLGDLGLVQRSELRYNSLDDGLITEYTAPEVQGENACLSDSMDIYSVGMILYEVYNGGHFPMGEEEHFVRGEAPMEPPIYADVAMSEIILKACAYSPEERYQSPEDMHEALSVYMQRGDVSSRLLVPQQDPDDAEVDYSEIAATVAAGQAVESGALPAEESESLPALSTETSVEPRASLNDLKEDDLLVPDLEEMSVEDFMATLRGNAGLEVVSMDSQGNMTVVPGYETEETLPGDTEFMDSADDHFAVLKNLAEMDASRSQEVESAPAPENTPEILSPDFDSLDPIDLDLSVGILSEEQDGAASDAVVGFGTSRPDRSVPNHDDVGTYDSGDAEDFEDEPYPEEERGSTWKKVLVTVIVLLVLAGGATSLYFLKTDTIRSVEPQVLSSSSVSITVDSKNHTPMEIVCSTASGEVSRMPLTSGAEDVVFTDLSPDTTYTFTIASTDGKLLLGSKTVNAKTKEMTNITGFAPISLSATSARLALGGVGSLPDKWVITLTSDSGENLVFESSDIPEDGIPVDGLTPETHYTAVVSTGDGSILGGVTTCEFTTMAYTVLSDFSVSSLTTDSVSLSWSFSGTVPDAWTVSYTGTDGSSNSQEIIGTECVLSELATGETYNITLSAPSLKSTDLASLSVGIPAVTVTGITAELNDDGEIEVSWDYTADTAPSQWRIAYCFTANYNSEGSTVASSATTVTSDTTSVTLTDLIPDTAYTITVVGADDLNVDCQATASCTTEEANLFTSYGCQIGEMTLYVLEDNPDTLSTPSDNFSTEEHIAFAIQATYEATEEDKHVTTTYVVRNSEGTPVQVYSGSRDINGAWISARHTGDLPNSVTVPGEYTLEVYFDGDFLASSDFTVS